MFPSSSIRSDAHKGGMQQLSTSQEVCAPGLAFSPHVSTGVQKQLTPFRLQYPPSTSLIGPTNVIGANQSHRHYLCTYLLVAAQFLIYVDRFTLYETWSQVRQSLEMNTASRILVFVLLIYAVQMAFAPMAGSLADRLNRLPLVGWVLVVWSVGSLASSLDWGPISFLVTRSLMAVAETTFYVISPPLIAELCSSSGEGEMLRRFRLLYLVVAIPIGSGVGYISGAFISDATHSWRWAIRVPALATILVLIAWRQITKGELLGTRPRGSEANDNSGRASNPLSTDGLPALFAHCMAAVGNLLRIPSFIFCSIGMASVLVVLERFNLFAPAVARYKSFNPHTIRLQLSYALSVCLGAAAALAFGLRMVGIWRQRVKCGWFVGATSANYKQADLVLCGMLLVAAIAPIYGALLLLGTVLVPMEWILIAAVVSMLCLSYGIAIDLLMQITPVSQRGMAIAVQSLLALLIETLLLVFFTVLWPGANSNQGNLAGQLSGILLLGALALFIASRFVDRDEQSTQP